jgi:hypothetical protein
VLDGDDDETQSGDGPELHFLVPDDLGGGTYANVLNVWHTAYEFTLDFGVMEPAAAPPEGGAVQVPVRLVSRVRIPVTLLFEVLKALNTNMTSYESTFGPIRQPEASESDET